MEVLDHEHQLKGAGRADYVYMSVSQETLGAGSDQGVYPFGVCVKAKKSRVFQIYSAHVRNGLRRDWFLLITLSYHIRRMVKMKRDCITDPENIYFRYRKAAAKYNEKLNSREGAAELLGISPSTLAHYELGVTKVVPPDAVVLMADLYKTPELKAHYCANDCPIGKGTPIATNINSIELVTVKMIKAFSQEDADAVKQKLVDIASDGQITENELPTLEWILSYLDNMAKTVSELRLTCQKVLAEGEYGKG